MNIPYFSIVMAAYNAEKYISDTIDSVLCQTYPDFELIVVDDGSTDDTASILEQYEKRDPRIKILSQPNKGPSEARNNGISATCGTYLYLMDSDDLLMPTLLDEFHHTTIQNGCSFAACGYQMDMVSERQTTSKIFSHEDLVLKNRSEFLDILPTLMNEHLMYVVWNKVYLRQMITDNGIKFTSYRSCEDRLFNIAVFNCAESFCFIDQPLYHYFCRGNASLVNRYLPDKLESLEAFYDGMNLLFQKASKLDDKNQSLFSCLFLKGILACFVTIFNPSCPLDAKGKNDYVKQILNRDSVRSAVSLCKTGGLSFKLIVLILKTRFVWLNKLMAWGIDFTSTRAAALLFKLKHKSSSNL
ncbi:MAG: hypothetical protein K0R90_322 [Oscillospiraceae bacterium]|jgi:glycosyltransferase involved in cell wall biosynthesis|nr:hypothetical protein [Oscillospiraceae bacterium]